MKQRRREEKRRAREAAKREAEEVVVKMDALFCEILKLTQKRAELYAVTARKLYHALRAEGFSL